MEKTLKKPCDKKKKNLPKHDERGALYYVYDHELTCQQSHKENTLQEWHDFHFKEMDKEQVIKR